MVLATELHYINEVWGKCNEAADSAEILERNRNRTCKVRYCIFRFCIVMHLA